MKRPAFSWMILLGVVTLGVAAPVPPAWRGPYTMTGTGTARITGYGENETVRVPLAGRVNVNGRKLDLVKTTYRIDDVRVDYLGRQYIPWKDKGAGFNAYATAPVRVTYKGYDTTLDGIVFARLALNSGGNPVLRMKTQAPARRTASGSVRS